MEPTTEEIWKNLTPAQREAIMDMAIDLTEAIKRGIAALLHIGETCEECRIKDIS